MAGFTDIFCDICLDQVKIIIVCSDKSSKFNTGACTQVVLDFLVFGGTNFSLIMRVFIFAFLIQFANFAKIKTVRKFLPIQ